MRDLLLECEPQLENVIAAVLVNRDGALSVIWQLAHRASNVSDSVTYISC